MPYAGGMAAGRLRIGLVSRLAPTFHCRSMCAGAARCFLRNNLLVCGRRRATLCVPTVVPVVSIYHHPSSDYLARPTVTKTKKDVLQADDAPHLALARLQVYANNITGMAQPSEQVWPAQRARSWQAERGERISMRMVTSLFPFALRVSLWARNRVPDAQAGPCQAAPASNNKARDLFGSSCRSRHARLS